MCTLLQYLDILPLVGAGSEHEAVVGIGANHTAEAVGGVSDARRQHLALQEGVDHRALPVTGPPKERHLGGGVCVGAGMHPCVRVQPATKGVLDRELL